MTDRMRRPAPEPHCGDDRPVGYQCWGCARHFVPAGTPKPVRRSDWQWRECLCDLPDCPANDIVKGMRR
jgi:hypothetical protein